VPDVAFAVNVDDMTAPFASVVSVSVGCPLAKVPLAPVAGAVNVTIALLMGFPLTSTTIPAKGNVNGALIAVLWGLPPLMRIPAGAEIVFVRLKLASVGAPGTDAVTI
jgi:hypothetical protein